MTPDLPSVEIAILKETNVFRRQQKLSNLKRNRMLDLAARRFAQYLARTGKFSHTADGRKPAERINAAGYKYCRIAENLSLRGHSLGFKAHHLGKLAVDGWKKSPNHRRNMLLPNVTEIGIGVAKAANKHRYLSVQLFARPQILRYKFQIRNETQRQISYVFAGRKKIVPARAYVRISACEPGKLKFPNSVRRADGQHRLTNFSPHKEDQFVISVKNNQLFVYRRP